MTAPLAAEMGALAGSLAAEHAGLDFSFASLAKLDRLAADARASAPPARALGAYLGEVLRRAAPERLAWAAEGTSPVIVSGSARWFPVEKVEKRRAHGPADDLPAFAGVVLALEPGAAERIDDARDRKRLEEALAAFETAAAAFRAAPTDAALWVGLEERLFGTVFRRNHRDALSAIALRPDEIVPLLGAPAFGRGRARRDPGRVAASLLAYLVALDLARRDEVVTALRARVGDRDKGVRTNVAQALVEIDLVRGSTAVALELGTTKDRALTEGALRAIRAVGGEIRMEDREPPVALEALAPVLRPALAPKSPHLAVALDAVNDWSFLPHTAVEARHLAPVLRATAAAAKPQAARFAALVASRVARAEKRAAPSRARVPSTTTHTFASVEPGATYAVSTARMSILRELMREVGALADPTARRALEDGPPTDPGAPPIAKYLRHASESVTPDECRVVARRLREHVDVVREVASFFDDAPRGSELVAWVSAWADFHARAAELGGHRGT